VKEVSAISNRGVQGATLALAGVDYHFFLLPPCLPKFKKLRLILTLGDKSQKIIQILNCRLKELAIFGTNFLQQIQ
jgi:hypothetical protein